MPKTTILMALLLGIPSAAIAQEASRSVEVSAGYSTWTGKNVEGFDPGPRFRATLFGESGGGVEVGITGVLGIVGLAETDDHAKEWGLGLTVRNPLGAPDRTHPFVELYAGWSQIRADVQTGNLVLRQSGFAVGPGLGLDFSVGSMALVLAGDVSWHRYGNIGVGGGLNLGVEGNSGWRYGGRLGVRLGG